ncbi:MAG: hypothetical protein CVU88_01950 [Firmicutes bacterium HGW-Firmicutes-13]|nr:MAG: hypothetical protein CVU88_01950 [Firmicutes bacterium HGW-Firmicutes-13]
MGMNERFFKGHSLIEILVALTIIAVVVIPVLSLFLQGYSGSCSAGMKTVAAAYGQEKMEKLKAQDFIVLKDKLTDNYYELPENEREQLGDFTRYYTLYLDCKEIEGNNKGSEGNEDDEDEEHVSIELLLIEVYVKWFDEREREFVLTSYLSDKGVY